MKLLDVLNMSGNKITGLGAPTLDGDAATRLYVNQQVAAAGGLDTEGVQDVISTTVVGTPSISFTYDDVAGKHTATVLDSPKLEGQTLTQVRTGIDAATLGGGTRAQVVAEAIAGVVDTAPATLDTLNELAAALGDDANFATTVNTALAARVRTFGATIGDGVATTYTVTHNLATRDVTVAVYDISGATPTYEEVWTTTRRTTINTVDLVFAAAPAAGQYRVVIQGRAD